MARTMAEKELTIRYDNSGCWLVALTYDGKTAFVPRCDLTPDIAVEYVLRTHYPAYMESNIINDAYYASLVSEDGGEAEEQAYLNYLTWRGEMKAEVKKKVTAWLANNPIGEEEIPTPEL